MLYVVVDVVVVTSCREDKGPVLYRREMPSSRDKGPVPGIFLYWGWVSVPGARHREWLPLPWSECDDRAGRKTFNVPNSRDWVLSLAQRGYGFGPLAGTLQHLAIRLSLRWPFPEFP